MSDNQPKHGTPEWHRAHPIFGTDTTKPIEDLIEGVRLELAAIRGKLTDIRFGYGWTDALTTAEHGLTLVISYLYHTKAEIEKAKL